LPRKTFKTYLRINKKHWDSRAKRDRTEKTELLKQIMDNTYLEKWEPKLGPYLKHIKGKRIIVPQFGDSLVMLALAKRGATVRGVDFSTQQVENARRSAEKCRVNVNLIEADWQNLPKSVPNDYFDMVVTECGIFNWIQRPDAWMKNAHRVLKKGGTLIVSDFHPFSIITKSKRGKTTVKKSYFDQNPTLSKEEADMPPTIQFFWRLSDILNSAIQAGFRVSRLEEFYVDEPGGTPLIPNNYLLVAQKSEDT
jgi:ubiquinone/menaquinone biosynthesis C-methylase UbiE